MPAVGDPDLDFPDVERATLSNGIQVVYARRTAVPVTRVAVEFDAGVAADPADALGTQALMLNLLDEGTTSLQLDPDRRGAGAARRARSAPAPRSTAPRSSLTALTPEPRRRRSTCSPTSSATRPSRRRRSSGFAAQQLAGDRAGADPAQRRSAARALPGLLYGADHPYGRPFTGTGDRGGGERA